jgi:hypothetical protein
MKFRTVALLTVVVATILIAGCLGGGSESGQAENEEPTAISLNTNAPNNFQQGYPDERKYRMQQLPEKLQPKVKQAIQAGGKSVELEGASFPSDSQTIAVYYNGNWYLISAE